MYIAPAILLPKIVPSMCICRREAPAIPLSMLPPQVARRAKESSDFFKIPPQQATSRFIAVCVLGALVWDYVDTILDLAAQMKIGHGTQKVSRAIRELRDNYNSMRRPFLTPHFVEEEKRLSLELEERISPHLARLALFILEEIRPFHLKRPHRHLLQAVYSAITILDALSIFADRTDKHFRKYYPSMRRSILPRHFVALRNLVELYVGDCLLPLSIDRKNTATVIANTLEKTAFAPSPD